MKTLLLILALLTPITARGGEKISALPLTSDPSTIATTDSFPYVNSQATPMETDRIQISDLPGTPAFVSAFALKAPLASPTFTGTVTAPTFIGAVTGNASTATQLASSPTQCSAGQYATGIDTFANLTCAAVVSLPSQTGNSGKYLTTDGTTASWNTIPTVTGHDVTVGSGLAIATGTGVASALNAFSIGIASGFYLPSTTDQTNWNAKQAAITTGTTSQYFKGDLSLGTFATDAKAVFSATAPIVDTSGVFSCVVATGSVAGCLSAADWTTFNGKQAAITTGTTAQYLKGDLSLGTFNTSVDSHLSGTAPIGYSAGVISCVAATGSVAGCLSAADWTTFNAKQAAITTGTTAQYLKGDLSLGTFNTSMDSHLSGTAPITYSSGVIACVAATGSVAGCLSAADWTTFNAKQAALTFTLPLLNTTNTITINNFTGDAGSGGTKGAVPAPATGDGAARKLLGARGSFATAPPGSYLDPNLASLDTAANSWVTSKPDNSDAENSVGDWVAYADAAATVPVDMTGGSPNTTCARNTSSPLDGTADFLMTLTTGASRQGEGCSLVVNIPVAYRGKAIRVTFPYITTGTIAQGDIVTYAYDVTNSSLLAPSTTISGISSSAGTLYSIFMTQTSTAQLRIGLHIARTSTAAATIEFDDVQVKQDISVANTPFSDWTPYSVTVTGSSSNPTKGTTTIDQGYWRRVGDSMEIRYEYNQTAAGSAGSGSYFFSIPSNCTIDSTKVSLSGQNGGRQSVGTGVSYDATNLYTSAVIVDDTTHLALVNQAGGGSLVGSSSFSFSNTVSRIGFDAMVPCAGWSVGGGVSPVLALSDYVSYTPIWDNNGGAASIGNGTLEGKWRRVGDSMEVFIHLKLGSTTSMGTGNAWHFAIPSGYAMDTVKTFAINGQTLGTAAVYDSSPNQSWVFAATAITSTSPNKIQLLQNPNATNHNSVGESDPVAWSTGTSFFIHFTVPISGWTSTSSGTLTAPRDEVQVDSGNGHGSSSTKYRRFSVVDKNVGSAITYADSSTAGATWTINVAGVYAIHYADAYSGGPAGPGITINDSAASTNSSSTSYAQGLRAYNAGYSGDVNVTTEANWTGNLNVGDVIRAKDNGTCDASSNDNSYVVVTRVSN